MQLSILTWILAYLIGSISPRYFLKQKHDLSPVPSAVMHLFDILKGAFPLLLALYLSLPPYAYYLTAFFTVIGHCFPFYLGFRGGKGAYTSFGALATLWIIQGVLALFSTFLLVFLTCVAILFYLCLLFLLHKKYHHKIIMLQHKEQAVSERHEELQHLAKQLEQKSSKKKGR